MNKSGCGIKHRIRPPQKQKNSTAPMPTTISTIKLFPMEAINIYPTGTSAKAISGPEGILTAATIRGTRIVYEFSYFNGNEYKQIWLDPVEFTVGKVKPLKVGYHKH